MFEDGSKLKIPSEVAPSLIISRMFFQICICHFLGMYRNSFCWFANSFFFIIVSSFLFRCHCFFSSLHNLVSRFLKNCLYNFFSCHFAWYCWFSSVLFTYLGFNSYIKFKDRHCVVCRFFFLKSQPRIVIQKNATLFF